MIDEVEQRQTKLRQFFELGPNTELIDWDVAKFDVGLGMAEALAHYNIEWYVVPSAEVVSVDDSYLARFYPMALRDFTREREQGPSYRDQIVKGHRKDQGRIIGVEATPKPRYLPANRQFYGTPYGHDASADPFAPYMGRAGMMNGTRYAHDYLSLRQFVGIVNEDWSARSILPAGYRVTVCPPAVFNLVGTVFHPEWSETESLELGFYNDEQGNATCYAVGSNAQGDFSYINEIEGEAEWSLVGFRVALVPL